MKMNRSTLILLLPLALFGLLQLANLQSALSAHSAEANVGGMQPWIIRKPVATNFVGTDGPYIFQQGDSLRVVEVSGADQIQQKLVKPSSQETYNCQIANEDRDQFSFQLYPNSILPPAHYTAPERLLAISDIEGNFNAFSSLLVANGVINEKFEWTFGAGHLVLLGDFVDRGEYVTQCLWLIYKLEYEALQKGGRVHFILGNHEVMNLEHDFRYVNDKYKTIARQVFKQKTAEEALPALLSPQNILMQWLEKHNCIAKIGNTLFVHGGISPELLESRLSIENINSTLQKYLQMLPADTLLIVNEATALVVGEAGPLWYRGMVKSQKKEYEKLPPQMVKRALRQFKVDRIVIGHTLVHDVSTDYDGKVIRIDVQHPPKKRTGKAQAMLIENEMMYRVNDLGERILLNK